MRIRVIGATTVAALTVILQANKVVQYGLIEDWTAEPTRAARALDALHRRALDRALRSVCS